MEWPEDEASDCSEMIGHGNDMGHSDSPLNIPKPLKKPLSIGWPHPPKGISADPQSFVNRKP